MTGKKLHYEDLMAEVLFGAPTDTARAQLDKHLQECDACRKEFRQLASIDAIASAREENPHSDPGEMFWLDFHDRVVERALSHAPARKKSIVDVLDRVAGRIETALFPKWAIQFAMAVVLILIGVGIGRVLIPTSDSEGSDVAGHETPTTVEGTEASALLVQAQKDASILFNRSEMILLQFVNQDVDGGETNGQFSSQEREVARDLGRQASAVQVALKSGGKRTLGELVRELEIVLVQIANLDAVTDEPGIEIVRDAIDRRALLFRINREQVQTTPGGDTRRDRKSDETSGRTVS